MYPPPCGDDDTPLWRTTAMKTFLKAATAVTFAILLLLVLLPRQAATATPEAAKAAAAAKAGGPCPGDCGGCCDCDGCGKCCDCGKRGRMPMMEGMKKHMEQVRKSVAALRDHEKKMEGITDPAEFRKAAIEHFRMVDDLQESHVKHMESMAGGAKQRHGHHGGDCKECPDK